MDIRKIKIILEDAEEVIENSAIDLNIINHKEENVINFIQDVNAELLRIWERVQELNKTGKI